MSTLLEQASLVMIPSGYKEDVVYSQIPTSGAGDLSFTRASNGTRVNSAGLVEVVPWNMAGYSEDFANAYWGTSGTGSSITSNTTTAPNGTLTADTFTMPAGTAYLFNGSFNLPIGEFTQSVYAKANTISSIRLEFVTSGFSRGAACIFDLSNGTAGTLTIYGGVSGFTASIESVGNGWYRCSIGGTITIADTYFWEVSIGTGSIFVWGAQINIGSTAKPYFPTTDRLNVPRLTYQNGGGGCPSLLLEKQSTNSFTYSEQFDNAAWVKIAATSVTANSAISPDGTQNADTLNSTTSTEAIFQVSASGTITFSVYAKAGTTTSLQLASTISFNGRGADFNLSNGTCSAMYQIGSGDADINGGTSSIVNVGNGWYRCIISGLVLTASRALTIANNNGNASYIWGAQCEVSSYPTSYIPTTSASATRVADVMTVNLPNTNMTFTAYLECEEAPIGTAAGDWLAIYSNVSILGRAYGYANTFGFADAYNLGVASGTKMVWKQESGSTAKLFKGGALVGTTTTGTYTDPFNRFRIDGAYLDKPLKIKEFVFFDNALTDAECIQLTA